MFLPIPISSDLQKLYDAAGLGSEDRAAIDNLSALDVAVTSDQKRSARDLPRRKRNADGGVYCEDIGTMVGHFHC